MTAPSIIKFNDWPANPVVSCDPKEIKISPPRSDTDGGTSDVLLTLDSKNPANASGTFLSEILLTTKKNKPVVDKAIPGHRSMLERAGKNTNPIKTDPPKTIVSAAALPKFWALDIWSLAPEMPIRS